jgi:hypothetical protein
MRRSSVVLLLALMGMRGIAGGQTLLSHDEILNSLYESHYDSIKKIGNWHCPQDKAEDPDSCSFVGDASSEIDVLRSALIEEDGISRLYIMTSASGHQGCHACAPLMGFGIFRFQNGQWQLESKNVTVRFGRWGEPGDVELVCVGTRLYGFMLTSSDGNGGYLSTEALLLVPDGSNIQEAWSGMLDEDNAGAYDPSGKDGPAQRAHVDAAYRFRDDGDDDHYGFQVISHGFGYGRSGKVRSRTAVINYHYVQGKYQPVNPLRSQVKEDSK